MLGTLVALLTVPGVALLHLGRTPTRRSAAAALAVVGGFWAYLFGYYRFARAVPYLDLTYVDRVLDQPGLFLAWVVVLGFGVVWSRRTTDRRASLAVLLAVGSWFALLGLNVLRPVFPGTVQTRTGLLLLAVPLVVVVLLASRGVALSRVARDGGLLLALLAGPIVLVWYALTAGLTIEYFDTAIRAQTFAHAALLIAAGVATARLAVPEDGGGHRVARGAIVAYLLVAVAVSAPLSVADLDTMTYPSVTTPQEFETAEFGAEHLDTWATDDPIQRVANGYHGAGGAGTGPVVEWVRNGAPPTCPTASRRSWTTSGAHLYPVPPGRVGSDAYRRWVAERNRVYSVHGSDRFVVTVPRSETEGGSC